MTDNRPDEAARTAWANQPGEGASVDLAQARAALARREAEVRKRDRIAYLCAVIIAPAWAAVMWFMPDLRVVAGLGFAVAVWVGTQTYRRSAARGAPPVDGTCVEYQQALLARERDFYLAMDRWYLAPVGLSQVVILLGFLTSPRFPRTAILIWGAAAFIGTSSAVLLVARRRWRRQASELQHELDLLNKVRGSDAFVTTEV